MLIIFDSLEVESVKALAVQIHEVTGNLPVVNPEDDDFIKDYRPGSGVHAIFTGYGKSPDSATLRYADLYLASVGARHWTDMATDSAIYAGDVTAPASHIVSDAMYAENRAALFAGYNVKYVGPTFTDPKYVFVVDNKRARMPHTPAQFEDIRALLIGAAPDFWKDMAIVSSGNVTALGEFLEHIEYSIPITYTDGGRAKLKHLGVEFLDHEAPSADEAYGIRLREAANRFSYKLSLS